MESPGQREGDATGAKLSSESLSSLSLLHLVHLLICCCVQADKIHREYQSELREQLRRQTDSHKQLLTEALNTQVYNKVITELLQHQNSREFFCTYVHSLQELCVCVCVFVGRAASREVVRGAGGEADRAGEPLPEAAGSCSLQTPGY